MATFDASKALLLDLRDLPQQPGKQLQIQRVVPAPSGLANPMIGVPPGSDLQLSLRLESLVDGVLVTGSVQGRVDGECARCLEKIHDELVVDFAQMYLYEATADDDDETEVHLIDGEQIDIEPELRSLVVLALPFTPLCSPDCPGLCAECGAELADHPDHHHEAPIDPRWAALQGFEPR